MRIRKKVLYHSAVIRILNKLGIKQYFSQSQEDKIIAKYFGDYKGSLLSIGENDGITFSNALYFILRGWSADLIEPSQAAFSKMRKLHLRNDKIMMHRIAVGEQNGFSDFYDSGQLVDLGDTSLVSTVHYAATKQWAGVSFKKTTIKILNFLAFYTYLSMNETFDLISIDAELSDLCILKQMDLTKLGCKCLIIEHAENADAKNQMIEHCAKHGLSLFHSTRENFVFTKGKNSFA